MSGTAARPSDGSLVRQSRQSCAPAAGSFVRSDECRAGTNDRSGDPALEHNVAANTGCERRACRGRQRQEHHIGYRTSVRLFQGRGIAWAIRSRGC